MRRRLRTTQKVAGLGAVGLLVGILLWAAAMWRARTGRTPAELAALQSRYENARPGVAYVGDTACAQCHAEIAESFRHHPMGRSLKAGPDLKAGEPGGDVAEPAFRATGLEYAVAHRDGKVYHRETRRDARGGVVTSIEEEVAYAVGSGRQGLTFLIERDGRIFESPITWYSKAKKWDLSPGYEGNNRHFERPVEAECLYCHANMVEPEEGTVNTYRPPTFRGLTIGCERCHGPGELHARTPRLADDGDATIVNPQRLEASLREEVCEQCHLKGKARVEAVGTRAESYRPGLPLDAFLRIYVAPHEATGVSPAVGQVEQMHVSRCFRESGGRFGCISCHDPHRLPGADERAGFFRDRCLKCHDSRQDPGCSLAEGLRRQKSPEDSCIDCHMPKSPLTDIPHVSGTDHTIPRSAEGRPAPATVAAPTAEQELLVPWTWEGRPPRARAEADRDLGVALSLSAQEIQGPLGLQLARRSLPLLEAALKARPEDLSAREAKGYSLTFLNRRTDALADLTAILALDPSRERALAVATVHATQLGRRDEALALARRTLAINPQAAHYHSQLARLLAQREEWGPAIDACLNALRLNPENQPARRLLFTGYLRQGDTARAREVCRTLIEFNPPDRDEFVKWMAGSR